MIMNSDRRRSYDAYYKEFCSLWESGCRLYYQDGYETSPRRLAETMALDTHATYMRDQIYDAEGRLCRIDFMRIGLRERSRGGPRDGRPG